MIATAGSRLRLHGGPYAAFGGIDIDRYAKRLSPVVAKRRNLLPRGGDGLRDDWSERRGYVKPTSSELPRWLRRALGRWVVGGVEAVVRLVPGRTGSE